jgi:pimeloyl-ACP methyl ester carboxylesterase
MPTTLSKLIVFITGAFISHNCWDEWKRYFESKGYVTVAPVWPPKEFTAEELRNRHPDESVASTRLKDMTEYFASLISDLPEQPILIGHSWGGLIVQLLLQRGLGAAGVAIHSFPPYGLGQFNFSFIKEWWEALGFFSSARTSYLISFVNWQRSVANEMSYDDQLQSYYAYAVPESKLLIRDVFTSQAKINFKTPRAPLLLTSGSNDELIPALMSYHTYKNYKAYEFVTDYKDFEGHNHLVFGETFWMEEAVFIWFWLQGIENI